MITVGLDLGGNNSYMTICDWSIDGGAGLANGSAWTPDGLCRYSTTYLQGYVSQIKHLLGWKFSDPELQSELDFLPFRVIEGPNGYPLVHNGNMGEDRSLTPIKILATSISSLESIASEEYPVHYKKFPHCIGVPIHFTNQQRMDMLAAARSVGLTSVSLLDETVAMVLGYENSSNYECTGNSSNYECTGNSSNYKCTGIVAFVYIGYASMQVCFAQFGSGTRILYQSYIRSLGTRDFNKVLFMHFASMIPKEYGTYVRFSDACDGLRKDLNKYDTASFCIKSSLGSKEIKGSIKRKKFENMSDYILKRIKEAMEKALADSGLDKCMVKSIEVVSDGGSMPAIINILKEIFEVERRQVRTSDEYIARGCAISQVPWIDKQRTSLTIGVRTSELFSKDDDSERSLWREVMDKKGASSTFISKLLGMNISRTGRLKRTEEWFWLYKVQSPEQVTLSSRRKEQKRREGREGVTRPDQSILLAPELKTLNGKEWEKNGEERDDRTSYTAENDKKQNGPDKGIEERAALQLQLSEAHKIIEQLMSERDEKAVLISEAHKIIEQLMSERDDARNEVKCVRYCVEYSYSELQDATNNFHQSVKLGEGGFGIVYKGILHNTTVAIKILKEGSSQGVKEFHQEIEILSKVRHPNLVTLLGACSENGALIYEYLPNGSLEDHLRCKNNTLPLSWQARVCIAFEICSALSFLHCSKPHGIVHGDLKPDNILLDLNNVSKVSDFGLCRQLKWTESASVPFQWTDHLKGTLAYMDPDYFSTGKITPQYDVYSFGIILLRLATCKDPRGIRNLVEEAQAKGKLKELIDALAGSWAFKDAKRMILLGLRCSDPNRKNRPDLSTKVWKEIKSMMDVASASVSSEAAALSS